MKTSHSLSPLVSTPEAAQTLGVSISFLQRHTSIPGAHRAGRVWRWDTHVVKQWMRRTGQRRAQKK